MGLVQRLEQDGVQLRLVGDKVIAKAEDHLTDEHRRFIREHKPELVGELRRRLPDLVEAQYSEAIVPLDAASRGIWKIHRVLGHYPEIGAMPSEVIAEFREDLGEIGNMTMQHVYRLIAGYWKSK